MSSPLASTRQSISRVGACAVGLAHAERSGNEPITYLIDLAGERIAVLVAARQRIKALDGVDAHVIDRADALLDAAIRSQRRKIGANEPAPAVRTSLPTINSTVEADMQPRPIQILTVEDDPSFRKLLTTVLNKCGQYHVRTADLDRWREDVREAPPDILLLDLRLGTQNAVADIPGIVCACPTTMVAALTGHPAEEEEPSVLIAGAFTFYEKTLIHRLPEYLEEDLALFRRALAGEDVVAPSALSRRRTTYAPSV